MRLPFEDYCVSPDEGLRALAVPWCVGRAVRRHVLPAKIAPGPRRELPLAAPAHRSWLASGRRWREWGFCGTGRHPSEGPVRRRMRVAPYWFVYLSSITRGSLPDLWWIARALRASTFPASLADLSRISGGSHVPSARLHSQHHSRISPGSLVDRTCPPRGGATERAWVPRGRLRGFSREPACSGGLLVVSNLPSYVLCTMTPPTWSGWRRSGGGGNGDLCGTGRRAVGNPVKWRRGYSPDRCVRFCWPSSHSFACLEGRGPTGRPAQNETYVIDRRLSV